MITIIPENDPGIVHLYVDEKTARIIFKLLKDRIAEEKWKIGKKIPLKRNF